ncbi:MAG: zf-HC2 domain-containing protein [Planctomycetaceae bacterium]
MSWNFKCRRVRKLLALWAGNDLEPQERVEAERHMTVCPVCREEWVGLRSGQQALEQARGAPGDETPHPHSVWPAVHRQICALTDQSAAPAWHGWLPVGALAAACLLVVVVTSQGVGPQGAAGTGAPIVVQPVLDPEAEMFGRPFDNLPLRGDTTGEWGGVRRDRPHETKVRMLLDGTDTRDL